MRAWILVLAKIDRDFDFWTAANQIKEKFKFDEVRNVCDVLGPYDVVVEVGAVSVDVIYEKYIKGINSLPAVSGLLTYLAVGTQKTKERELKKPTAYLLVDATPESLGVVQERIFGFDEVQKCDIVLGPYDIIAEIVTKNLESLTQLVAQICRLNGLVKTLTMVVV